VRIAHGEHAGGGIDLDDRGDSRSSCGGWPGSGGEKLGEREQSGGWSQSHEFKNIAQRGDGDVTDDFRGVGLRCSSFEPLNPNALTVAAMKTARRCRAGFRPSQAAFAHAAVFQ
jgi:hypothetical protein